MKPLRATLPALTLATLWFACSGDPPTPVDPYPPKPCSNERDCPAPVTMLCGKRSCEEGFCKLEVYEKSRSDVRGDCYATVCSSGGYGIERPDFSDVRDDGNSCTKDYCEDGPENAFAVNKTLDPGPAPNGSGFCNDTGRIVECLKPEDCGDIAATCSRFARCIPLTCTNHARDEATGETGIDCGGLCDGCGADQPCESGNDCLSGVCGDDKRCVVPSCKDGIKNEDETDVDCGGKYCDRCPEGQGCENRRDCMDYTCFAGKCQPRTCADGVRNGDEEDIDCGADCPPCQY